MLKRNVRSSVFRFVSIAAFILVIAMTSSGCDRGASEQIQAAQKFADAIAHNNTPGRDSMVATRVFKKYFENPFVTSDFLSWMRTMYDIKSNKFLGTARADVDRDLKPDLENGGLLTGDEIEETGMVRVKSPNEGEPAAYFWMVKQKGHHWGVAMVTKGEMAVHFK